MSITDELREWAVNHRAELNLGQLYPAMIEAIADRIDERHEKELERMWDEAEGADPDGFLYGDYVKLPVDADGVPIRVGDEMEVCSTCSIEVIGVGNVTEDDGTYGVFCQREDGRYEWFNARFLHHVQPDSWESIIEDARTAEGCGSVGEFMERFGYKLVERCRRLAGDGE